MDGKVLIEAAGQVTALWETEFKAKKRPPKKAGKAFLNSFFAKKKTIKVLIMWNVIAKTAIGRAFSGKYL